MQSVFLNWIMIQKKDNNEMISSTLNRLSHVLFLVQNLTQEYVHCISVIVLIWYLEIYYVLEVKDRLFLGR